MTIADTLKARFGRFNPPRQGRVRAHRHLAWPQLVASLRPAMHAVAVAAGVGVRSLSAAAVAGARALPRRRPGIRPAPARARRHSLVPWVVRPLRLAVYAGVLLLIGRGVAYEMGTSDLEATFFTKLDRGLHFTVGSGPSKTIQFPTDGPYDERLGYTRLPQFINSLLAERYQIDDQARWSPEMVRFVHFGGFPIYQEKDTAGLKIFDEDGKQIYGVAYPQWVYPDFASIPPLIANSLAFIEDKYLLDTHEPQRNPAIEWQRFGLAAAGRVAGLVVPGIHVGGGSTLATQIEKFRHSNDGRTRGVTSKLRQMLTASARGYIDGRDTLERRHEILTTYLNSTPLGSMPGYGEIIGVPEAMRIWFGTDYRLATRILNAQPGTEAELARKGTIYRQALALVLSERRPSYYLMKDHHALALLIDRYLRALCDAGVIAPRLRDAALAAHLYFKTAPPPLDAVSYVRQKESEDVRDKLVGMLGLPDLYALDRLDLSAQTAIDTDAQARVSQVLQSLASPKVVRGYGMVGKQLLGGGDLSKVTWSFVLYQRGNNRNFVRIEADSLNKPFDINSGAKLMMGSTAKLRTLVTYLDIVTVLHDHFAPLSSAELRHIAGTAQDPLTQWAAQYLSGNHERALQPMLDAAMDRTYSAAPATFFTGGGNQGFGNFESTENSGDYTVELAFQHSINLVFVRLLRDVVSYYTAASGVDVSQLFGNPDDPQRMAYLHRFVDADSKHFLYRFYKDYRGLTPQQALDQLARRTRPIPTRMAAVYLSVFPDARIAQFQAFLNTHLPNLQLSNEELWHLYLTYSPQRLNLSDRGYISGLHPLELWLVSYLDDHRGASWDQVVKASAKVREEAYRWLFKGGAQKQDARIRILLEQDAFGQIINNWRATGYPFAHLVPSLGTVLGASGDRPEALAELMGIIVNDGVREPTVTLQHLQFAAHTPYQTDLSLAGKPERVMPVEVARTLRRALTGVVTDGTASRVNGAYTAADGTPLPIGGKTGTGDNRFDYFAAGGGISSSRVVDRTATFVFFLGDRFYGTATVYVPGRDAARFSYTSALAVQLLKVLKPELTPLIDAPRPGAAPGAVAGADVPSREQAPPRL